MAPQAILHTRRPYGVDDREQALAWLERYNLGTLITVDDGWPRATTSPLVVDRGDGVRLYAHVDRRNPQVDQLASGGRALYVAEGPRAYVSPAWIRRRPAAPTYLHITVHVRARPRPLDDEGAAWLLLETVDAFERRRAEPWRFDGGERYLHGMAKGVFAFELMVEAIEAACKLSQDRDDEEREAIAEALAESDSSDERAIARMLRHETTGRPQDLSA